MVGTTGDVVDKLVWVRRGSIRTDRQGGVSVIEVGLRHDLSDKVGVGHLDVEPREVHDNLELQISVAALCVRKAPSLLRASSTKWEWYALTHMPPVVT